MIKVRKLDLYGIRLEPGHVTPRTRQFFKSKGVMIEDTGDTVKLIGGLSISSAEAEAFLKQKKDDELRLASIQSKVGLLFLIMIGSFFLAASIVISFASVTWVPVSIYGIPLMTITNIPMQYALTIAALAAVSTLLFAVYISLKYFSPKQDNKIDNKSTDSAPPLNKETVPALKPQMDVMPVNRVNNQKTIENKDNNVSPVQELGFFALPKSVSTTSTQCQALGVTDAVPTLVN